MAQRYLRIREERDRDYFHVRLEVVEVMAGANGREVLSGMSDDTHGPMGPDGAYKPILPYLCNFEVSCQSDRTSERDSYGWRANYRSFHRIDLDLATAIQKTLGKVDKDLGKLNDQLGYPSTFGDFCVRIGLVLKVAGFVQEGEWGVHRLSIGDGKGRIDNLIRNWREVADALAA